MTERRGRLGHSSDRPVVSIVMANHNGARHLEQAVRSVLDQSLTQIELIVSDDASTDASLSLLQAMQQGEPRLRLITAARNGGPARSRNDALAIARGEWIAIVDSDDIIHPERFERLLAVAGKTHADIVADDLLYFYEDGSPCALLLPLHQTGLLGVDAVRWITAGRRGTPALGYLKPMIRAATLGAVRYDETLRIGEDYDLVLRLLLNGASMQVVPEPWYLYRRHRQSTSHRLAATDVEAMIASQERLTEMGGKLAPAVAAAFDERLAGLRRALAFARLVSALKSRNIGSSLGLAMRHPSLLVRLANSIRERVGATRVRRPVASQSRPTALAANVGGVPEDVNRIVVPPFEQALNLPTGGTLRRDTWRRIAELASGGPASVTCEDAAGIYAAGFIPSIANRTIIDAHPAATPALVA